MSEDSEKTNPFCIISDAIDKSAEKALRETCRLACENMRQKLVENGHVKTGELVDSIDFTMSHTDDKITAKIEMAKYGKFIDEGTGAAHGVEGGREGYWRYKDKNGQWHTTNGMDADPFIDISLENALLSLPDALFKQLESIKAGGST